MVYTTQAADQNITLCVTIYQQAVRNSTISRASCSKVNSTLQITSELTNQSARKALYSLVWYILSSHS